MKQKNLAENKYNIFLSLILIISIILGFLIRIKGLGKWPLAVDEYYIVKSVQSILKNGLPRFAYGGYYDRGILYQYLTSLLLLSGMKVEFAARIIPLITNLLVIHPLYLLSKKVGGKTLAVTIIIVFSLSVWEVEFARFARMYSPFQLIFIWYLYFLYRKLIEDEDKAFYWLLILSFLSIFIYEASIFLAVLNFLPFIWDYSKKTFDFSRIREIRKSYINFLFTVIIFVITYAYLSINFNVLGTSNNLPTGINFDTFLRDSSGNFRVPLILIRTILLNPFWILPFLITISLCIYSFFKIQRGSVVKLSEKLSFLFIIILSLLNLFGLAVFIIILFLLINWIEAEDLKENYKYLLIITALPFVFWSLYSIFTSSWHYYFLNKEISGVLPVLKVVWKEFIDFPYLYEAYALFRDTIPRFTSLTIILLTSGIFISVFIKNSKKEGLKFLFFIFLLLVLFVTSLNLTYFKTRYFFFFYPLLILLNISTIKIIADKFPLKEKAKIVSFLILIAVYMIFSEDFNIHHLYNIDSKEVNFRKNYSMLLKDHYYPRWDVKTPDEFVNKNFENGDIIIIDEPLNEFYLKHKADYIYEDYKNAAKFEGISRVHGTREKWTGDRLIYENSDLKNLLLKRNSYKWLIINTIWGNWFQKEDYFYKMKKYEVFCNNDTTTIVYKIPPKPIF